MKGYITDIENDTLENKDFRRVLYTGKNSQLVLMRLRPKEEIGEETHSLDQFIRVEAGEGVAILDGVSHPISDGTAVVIPAGTKHNVANNSDVEELKLYTLRRPSTATARFIRPKPTRWRTRNTSTVRQRNNRVMPRLRRQND